MFNVYMQTSYTALKCDASCFIMYIVDIGLTDVNFDLLSLCLVTLYGHLTNRILLVFAILIIKGLPLSSRFDFYSLGSVIAFAVDILHPILQVPIIFYVLQKTYLPEKEHGGVLY